LFLRNSYSARALAAQAPYSEKGRRDTTNDSDGIYRRGGTDLMLQLTKVAQAYVGTYKVGFLLN
jgi:hypothetical protein